MTDSQPEPLRLGYKLFEALNTRDFAGLEEYVTDSVVLDFPGAGRIEGYRKVVIFMKALLRRYTRLEFNVYEVITTPHRVFSLWNNEGVRADGKPYVNRGITLFHLEDGKIIFISDYFKDTSFTSGQ
jgi:ketosteroid isomerase-like protein